jgi:hypothetical protein
MALPELFLRALPPPKLGSLFPLHSYHLDVDSSSGLHHCSSHPQSLAILTPSSCLWQRVRCETASEKTRAGPPDGSHVLREF